MIPRKSWVDPNFYVKSIMTLYRNMWKNENFAVTFVKSTISPPDPRRITFFFLQKFRQINFFNKAWYCTSISRKGWSKFRTLSLHHKIVMMLKYFCEKTKIKSTNLVSIWIPTYMVYSCKALEALAVSRKKTHFRKNWDCKKRFFHTMALW